MPEEQLLMSRRSDFWFRYVKLNPSNNDYIGEAITSGVKCHNTR